MPEKKRRQDSSPSAKLCHPNLIGERDDDGKGSDANRRVLPADEQNERYTVVKLSAIQKEFQCPICLGIIRETRTVKECLHRFCRECIDKSMRLGKNECPTCRTYCASRRSLRDDPSYDSLIATIYSNVNRYEEEQEMTFHEEEKARNKQVQDSIAETFQRQSVASGRKRSAFTRETANYRNVRSGINHRTSEHKGSDGEGDVDGDNGGKDLSSAENSLNLLIHPASKDDILAQSRLTPLKRVTCRLEEERTNLLKQGSTLSAVVSDLVEKAKSASNLILMSNRRLLHLENDTQHEDAEEYTRREIIGNGESLLSMHQQKILELEKELESVKIEHKKNECQLELLEKDKEEILKRHEIGKTSFFESEQGKAELKVKIDEYIQSADFQELMRGERQRGRDEAIRSPELYKLMVQVALEMKCGAVTETVNLLAPMIPRFDLKKLPRDVTDFYDERGAQECYRLAKTLVLAFGMVEVLDSDSDQEE